MGTHSAVSWHEIRRRRRIDGRADELKLAAEYVSQLERGTQRPSGPALVLRDVVRRKGIEAIL